MNPRLDAVVSISPLVILIYMMTKKKSIPSNIALPRIQTWSTPPSLKALWVESFAQAQRQVMADKKVARYFRLENKIQTVVN